MSSTRDCQEYDDERLVCPHCHKATTLVKAREEAQNATEGTLRIRLHYIDRPCEGTRGCHSAHGRKTCCFEKTIGIAYFTEPEEAVSVFKSILGDFPESVLNRPEILIYKMVSRGGGYWAQVEYDSRVRRAHAAINEYREDMKT